MVFINPELKQIVRAQLEERHERSGAAAERALTTVKSEALVDLQFRMTVEGHEFIVDERKSSGSHDAGPAPVRYYLGGIMGCYQVWFIKSAALADLSLDRFEAEISSFPGGRASSGGSPQPHLLLTIIVDSGNTDDQIRMLAEQAAQRCGIFMSTSRATRIELVVVHNGNTILERAYAAGEAKTEQAAGV